MGERGDGEGTERRGGRGNWSSCKNSHFKKDVLSRHMIKQKPSKIYQFFLF